MAEQVPQMLLDMRLVYNGQLVKNPPLNQQKMKILFEKDYAGFLTRMERLEKEYRASKPKNTSTGGSKDGEVGTKPVVVADEGHVRARELARKLVEEIHAQHG